MIILYKDPEGNTVFKSNSTNSSVAKVKSAFTSITTATVSDGPIVLDKDADQAEIISTLRKRVTELEQTLLQMKESEEEHTY